MRASGALRPLGRSRLLPRCSPLHQSFDVSSRAPISGRSAAVNLHAKYVRHTSRYNLYCPRHCCIKPRDSHCEASDLAARDVESCVYPLSCALTERLTEVQDVFRIGPFGPSGTVRVPSLDPTATSRGDAFYRVCTTISLAGASDMPSPYWKRVPDWPWQDMQSSCPPKRSCRMRQ